MNLRKKKLAVFCSGGGSNFKALHKNIREKNLPCEIALCLSNNSQSGAMQFARDNNIDAVHLSSRSAASEEAFIAKMLEELHQRAIDFILLAGYMKHIPKEIIAEYPKRILNIHPALLPKFGGAGMFGMNVHRAVIESRAQESGATVHFVDEGYDTGEILIQKSVQVLPSDTPESLAEKVLQIEHQIYTEALEKILRQP